MTVRKATRRGQPRLVIDIVFTKPDGTPGRYRKDAQVQTMAAARAEERRLLSLIAQYGEPFEPAETLAVVVAPKAGAKPANGPKPPMAGVVEQSSPSEKTFADVVAEYKASFMITDLKPTSRRGYASVLESTLLPRFGEDPISKVEGAAASALDVDLSKRQRARATRNNIQIVLRSVLQFAVKRKYLADLPANLPRLKPVEQTLLEIPSDEQVKKLLDTANELHRRAFALMVFAGLRPNELRALRRKDVKLRREEGATVGGFLSIREGRSYGEVHTPKTGQREIPIAPQLAPLLAPVEEGPRDGHVAVNKRGTPWGQFGVDRAFKRVGKRIGLEEWSVYCLRHYAITLWLRAGIPVHVVQRMAGHKHLSTTQRYVHHLKEDLDDAARRMAAWNSGG
ncbi:tyrosine-type recombinase/integrase [Polyangium mundeleinium]|uniref:Site-specific integrase n=1 Tax=Polyangium mundeleinium TaxID=2995306 RepID=A0ABT5EGT2_9BACT|nr:site-specific integrase [Polyangium mundeleinium]MDC0740976.1 site-specific integrase [Polyangium mundeleinium]